MPEQRGRPPALQTMRQNTQCSAPPARCRAFTGMDPRVYASLRSVSPWD